MTKPATWQTLIGLALVVAGLAACEGKRDPIYVNEGVLFVENQTDSDWTDVTVTVNDHFAGGTPRVAAGSRLSAPLNEFKTAFGQRYDRTRQSVFKVEVKATDADGKPVALAWDGERRPE
jgi:hypothetical protein